MAKISINIATGSLQKEDIIVGIDLGTTNSLVAIIHPDTKKAMALKDIDDTTLVPSIIHLDKDGQHTVGNPAKSFLETDKSKYEALVDLSRKYLSEAQVSLMRFSLGLHVYSPKIEMFQQIAMVQGVPQQKCEAVIEVNGKLTCDSSLIKTLLNEKPK